METKEKQSDGVLVKIKDLIGRPDVDGLLVDLRTRVNGELKYSSDEGKPVIARLKRVYWKYKKSSPTDEEIIKWMYWEWYVTPDMSREWCCGFSGNAVPKDTKEYQLLILDPNWVETVRKQREFLRANGCKTNKIDSSFMLAPEGKKLLEKKS